MTSKNKICQLNENKISVVFRGYSAIVTLKDDGGFRVRLTKTRKNNTIKDKNENAKVRRMIANYVRPHLYGC